MPDPSAAQRGAATSAPPSDAAFNEAFRRAAELAVSAEDAAGRLETLGASRRAALAARDAAATELPRGGHVYVGGDGAGVLVRVPAADARAAALRQLDETARALDTAEALLAEYRSEWAALPSWARAHVTPGPALAGVAPAAASAPR
jgi:hypothetical protein